MKSDNQIMNQHTISAQNLSYSASVLGGIFAIGREDGQLDPEDEFALREERAYFGQALRQALTLIPVRI